MKKRIFLSVIIAMIAFAANAQKKENHNIVFQFTNASDTLQQKAFIKQLENITEHWPTAQFEVVVYNQGVELVLLSNKTYREKLLKLKAKGVKFVVCENTLKNRKIEKSSLQEDIVGYVPAGIAELVLLQEKGWSYIKGGF